MAERGGEVPGEMAGRTGLGRGGDQFGGDPGQGPAEHEFSAAAEIERELGNLDLGAFRGIDEVHLALVDRDAALRQPSTVDRALAQGEVEPGTLGLALVEVDPGPQGPGNRG